MDRPRRVVAAIALASFAFHLAFASRYGWFRDELYYVACARRLSWGYVDHPPLVAVVARVSLALFGESLVGLRAFAALAGAGSIVLSAEIARAMGGERFAQPLAAFLVAIAPYDLVVAHIYTMNGLEPLAWSGIALVAARALNRETGGNELYWLGPIAGLGVLNKHSAAWPAVALLVSVAILGPRKLLADKKLWITAALGAAIVAPHVLWQFEHDFPTREFAKNALSGKNEPYGPLAFVWQLVQLTHPLAAPVWVAGLVALFASRPLRPYRPLGLAFLLMAALVFATQAKAYYLGPAFGTLFAAGAVFFEQRTERRARAARVVFPIVVGLGSAALLPMVVPVLTVPQFQRYFDAMGGFGEAKSGEKMGQAALPQIYADMHGWPEMAAAVADVIDRLPPEERESVLVFGDNYGEASAVDFFGRARGIHRVASGNNGWWLWGPPGGTSAGWPAVVVTLGADADDARELFDEVEEAGVADHPYARADERRLPILICRKPRVTLGEAWPKLKHYR